jgi:DNA repair protein RadD
MKTRFYQDEGSDALVDTLFNEPQEAPLVAMPTGTGKSVTIARATKLILERVPSANLIIATHSQELVDQDAKTLSRFWDTAPYGVYSAGLGLKQSGMPITIGNIQSMVNNPEAFGKVSGVIIDEAQAVSPNENSMYQKFFSALRKKNEHLFVAGLTATPYRLGQGLLADGPTFSKVCYDVTGRVAFVKFIDMGYLCPLIPKKTSFEFDVSKVKQLGGDFNQKQLQEALDVDELTMQALDESLQVAADRNHWMIFCAGIEHVESVTALLNAIGESAVAVHSKMHPDVRKANIQAFREGRARMIVNDGILTTGVDFPHVDCIVLLRPTSSPGLHVQILGRGTRCDYDTSGFDLNDPRQLAQWFEFLEDQQNRLDRIYSSHKHNCLVLDFSGNTLRCGPINDPRIPQKKKKGTGEVPVKICPCCDSYVHAAVRFCDGINWDGSRCNHEFQFETHLETSASTEEVIVRDKPEKETPQCYWFRVDRIEYEPYNKPFTPPMMRVRYICGIKKFTEMVCIEHRSFAGTAAVKWWRTRLPSYPPPPTTHDGFSAISLLKEPTHIYVQVNSQWPKIRAVSWDGTTPENPNAKTS